MNAGVSGTPYCLKGLFQIALMSARQAGDDGRRGGLRAVSQGACWAALGHMVAHDVSDLFDGRKVVWGRSGKPCFNDVYPEARKSPGNLELFLGGHGCAWGLLPIAQRRIKDAYVVGRDIHGGVSVTRVRRREKKKRRMKG